MTDQNNTDTRHSTKNGKKDSSLSKFELSFEYDRTWNQAKQSVQHRPIKNS